MNTIIPKPRSKREKNRLNRLSSERVKEYKFYMAGNLSQSKFQVRRTGKEDITFNGGASDIELLPGEEVRVLAMDEDGKTIELREVNRSKEPLFFKVEALSKVSVAEPQVKPPLNAEYLLHLFLKADERDAVIGDLLERFGVKCERFGERRAKLWFYGEVLRSLWPLLKRLVARAGGLVALGEWIRRHVQ